MDILGAVEGATRFSDGGRGGQEKDAVGVDKARRRGGGEEEAEDDGVRFRGSHLALSPVSSWTRQGRECTIRRGWTVRYGQAFRIQSSWLGRSSNIEERHR